ncbi:hypothetical protein TVAG_446590 [Trichomonas vaginalis G3]|uniref:Initiator binding domain-containing protein n=1 Tax=Trichomonas vaginalis (strain ATCC PRA-98 / G3) TaxID=412133 RepID=A2E8L8_TRIV3|nr:transcription-initiator DNA-binding domain ibd family [Trichomonas vaginalis G3]EAY10957.1 hypothetical protein TVAG_446590 [Trichomonas vaginalis G3]KAI5530850.1 transcription-initiator DNA-binding domain ibd family [Trichomonas vaginalis G3]|eukprot:XP_001323180.1 hypothetical protein [Trichomonas vaginalis G3]
MAELCTLIVGGRHFMSLTAGFPIPKHKSGALQQILGMNFYYPDSITRDDFEFSNTESNEELNLVSRSFNAKITPPHKDSHPEKASDIIIEPHNIGLLPASEWSPRQTNLEEIKASYFTRRNGTARSFDLKLYNALCITKNYESAYKFVGVMWIDSKHFKINEKIFSQFLGNKSEFLTLFDKQGLINKYGFEQVFKGANPVFSRDVSCDDVDDCTVCSFKDPLNRFSRDKPFERVDL